MSSTVTVDSAATKAQGPLEPGELAAIDRYWRAANYLSVGQIYLMANPLLTEPLRPEHIKPRLLGHWGTTPGLNLVYVHLNRVIKAQDLEAMYVIGPGHGGPGSWPTPTWRAPTARSTPRSDVTPRGCAGCSGSSPSPAGSPAMSHRRRLARSMRVVSSGTRWCTPTAPPSTTPTCLWPAWSGTAR